MPFHPLWLLLILAVVLIGAVSTGAAFALTGEGNRFAGQLRREHALDSCLVDLQRSCELTRARRVSARRRELAALPRELSARALQITRNAQQRASISEVAADLSFDDRCREGGEGDAAVFVEAVGGLDKAHRADLHQVIQRLTAPGEATGNRMRQR